MSGRVEAGHIQNGSSVVVLPANEAASVKSESHMSECSCCHACLLCQLSLVQTVLAHGQ